MRNQKAQELIENCEHVKELIEQSKGNLYAIVENNHEADVEIVQGIMPAGKKDYLRLHRDMLIGGRLKSLGETICELYGLKERLIEERKDLKAHPVKEQYAWWSTGRLMNADKVNAFIDELNRLAKKVRNIDGIIEKLEQGTYEIRKHELE